MITETKWLTQELCWFLAGLPYKQCKTNLEIKRPSAKEAMINTEQCEKFFFSWGDIIALTYQEYERIFYQFCHLFRTDLEPLFIIICRYWQVV